MGNHTKDVLIDGQIQKAGTSITWIAQEVHAKEIKAQSPSEDSVTIRWDDAAQDPGWCKIDWVVSDPQREKLVNVSNMLDVTWESPDGDIIPLDGYLDSYFLDAKSVPIFSKLSQHVSANALDNYV